MIGTNEINFSSKLLLNDKQFGIFSGFYKQFIGHCKITKTQLYKIVQSGESWFAANEKCFHHISQDCTNTTRINSSSLNSECRNS